MPDNEHNKIIKQAAQEILKPLGLFQKGSSRIWIDDNGWFLVVVEFQPSAWSKGAYLNVGICFMWTVADYISFDYGDREKRHITFTNAESFKSYMQEYAEFAKEKVLLYRKFIDLAYARNQVLGYKSPSDALWGNWNKAIICFLTDCFDKGKEYLDGFSKNINLPNEWVSNFVKKQTEELSKRLLDKKELKNYIYEEIKQGRDLRRKTELKKMSESFNLPIL